MTAPAQGNSTVIGMFDDRSDAERAIEALKEAGFRENQIGVAMRDKSQQKDLSDTTGAPVAEGAAKGAVSGGIVGGIIGLLGSLLIPGVGPIVVAGELASVLTGAAAGAATGGIIGALVGMGATEDEAKHFDTRFREGGILVTVNAPGRTSEAREILRDYDADLGPVHGTARGTATGTGAAAGMTGGRRNTADLTDEQQRLILREEELDVNKERVQTGEVRLRKEVVTENRTIDVPVTREEVVIERHAASGDVSGDMVDNGEIRVPVSEERVNVNKRNVAKEEISVGKRKVEDVKHVSETVAHEEARIESAGDATLRTTGGADTYGGALEQQTWRGTERRVRRDPSYSGRERRTARL